jgi:long-chain acyl-CoA synthetase
VAELGFFRQAAAAPDRIAVVDPEGAELPAGALAARANQVSHGLRALGLQKGDTVAVVLPNGIPMLEVFFGAVQIGLYITPINHHLVGPEIAYIVRDSDAKAIVGHERFATALAAAVAEIGFPLSRAFAVGQIEGWEPYGALTAGQPDSPPEARTAGAPMHYTSGTTGRPKGVKRPLVDIDPDDLGALFSMFLMMFGVQPEDGNVHITGSPLYHTAVLLWTVNSLNLGHKVVLMDKWSPAEMLELIERHQVTTSHMVPTQFHRLLALPTPSGRSTTRRRCGAWCTRPRHARSRSSGA